MWNDFKSQNIAYTSRFLRHLKSFIETYQLFTLDTPLLLTVSGGIDSMALCYALVSLRQFGYQNPIRVFHINHGTRPGQADEARMVSQFCSHLGLEFLSETFEGLSQRNFEYRARQLRYQAFYQIAKKEEQIVLAHHIDDSFEWTLLQSLRSSSIEGLIGIPLKNDRVVRPFMCVTKFQIKRFAESFDLPFIEDPTNEVIKYERNYIRNQIIQSFKSRYPKYLKHYVFRHNEIARRLGQHLLEKNHSHFRASYGVDSVLIFSLERDQNLSGLDALIVLGMKHLNPNGRGTLSVQIKKIKQAMQNHKRGPLALTKGIQAYLDHNLVLLTGAKPPQLKLAEEFKTYSYTEFQNLINEYMTNVDRNLDFPFFVVISGSTIDKRQFKTSFNTNSVRFLMKQNVNYYPALKLLREWSKKRYRDKVLRLKLMMSELDL